MKILYSCDKKPEIVETLTVIKMQNYITQQVSNDRCYNTSMRVTTEPSAGSK